MPKRNLPEKRYNIGKLHTSQVRPKWKRYVHFNFFFHQVLLIVRALTSYNILGIK